MSGWSIEESSFICPKFTVETRKYPGVNPRYVVKTKDAVAALVVCRGYVLEVLVYREPLRKEQWEIPAGGIEEGEDPAEAASREVHEETGVYLAPNRYTLVRDYYPLIGIATERMKLYHVEIYTSERPALSPRAGDSVTSARWTHLDDFLEGRHVDSKSLVAREYLRAQQIQRLLSLGGV